MTLGPGANGGMSGMTRWGLFLAGLFAGATGGLFYLDHVVAGALCLAAASGALWFALRRREAEEPQERGVVGDGDLSELALFVAELAVSGLKGVGRTIPPSTKEIEQLEGRLNVLLDHMGVSDASRADLRSEFERIKGRTRRNEGGIALIRSRRL